MLKMCSFLQPRATLLHFFLQFCLRKQGDLWERDIPHCSGVWVVLIFHFTNCNNSMSSNSNGNLIERWYLELYSEEHCQQVEGVHPSPLLVLLPHLECCVWFWVPQYKRQCSAPGHKHYYKTEASHLLGKAERTWTILVLEKSRLRKCISLLYISNWKEIAEKMEPGFSSGAQRQDWRQWAPSETQDVPSEHQETLFYCVGLSTGRGHLERLWSNF